MIRTVAGVGQFTVADLICDGSHTGRSGSSLEADRRPPTTTADPSDGSGPLTIDTVSGSPSGSLSFCNTGTVTAPPFGTDALSSAATGRRLAGSVTVSVRVDESVRSSPSLIVYVPVNTPTKSGSGVIVTCEPDLVSVPLPVTSAAEVTVRPPGVSSGSVSLASTSKVVGTPGPSISRMSGARSAARSQVR